MGKLRSELSQFSNRHIGSNNNKINNKVSQPFINIGPDQQWPVPETDLPNMRKSAINISPNINPAKLTEKGRNKDHTLLPSLIITGFFHV